MSLKRPLFLAVILAVAFVALAYLIIAIGPDAAADVCRLAILPGFIIDATLSGNPHQGFGGVAGVTADVLASIVIWTIPAWIFIRICRLLLGRGNNNVA
jgi:hypothetical protein